jgi:putative ABC transport system permease protein
MASLVGACGILALTLCVVGLYGTVAYSVARRTREIGIRMALGAEPAQVVRLVVAQGIRLTAAGVVIGLGAAAAASRLVAAFLYEVGQHDVLTYAAVALVLVGASLAASFVPAKRALAIQPAQALVHE